MVYVFLGTLVFSIFGLALLLGVKYWELTSGRIVFASLRPTFGRYARAIVLWVGHIIPTLARLYSRWALRQSLTLLYRSVALLVLRLEQWLEGSLQKLRHSTETRRGMNEASQFLREVAEHKRRLLHTQRMPVQARKEQQ